MDREIAEKAAEYRSTIQTLYTIDIDFTKVEQIKVEAPQMNIKDWVKQYGTQKQREILRLYKGT